ncbi:MAG: hypothetical protein ACFFAH_00075 [Promethearchaeota archaeon]
MTVSFGKPHMEELGIFVKSPEYKEKIDLFLNKRLIDSRGHPFIVRRVSEI